MDLGILVWLFTDVYTRKSLRPFSGPSQAHK